MRNIIIFMIVTLATTGCLMTYTVGGKAFKSQSAALDYHKNHIIPQQLNTVEPAQYFGGSMLVYIPSDDALIAPPYVQGVVAPNMANYFQTFLKNDFDAQAKALEKSKMFSTVKAVRATSFLTYAKKHGYRYVFLNNGSGTFTVYDLLLSKDKTVRFPIGLGNLVSVVEDTILKFEKEHSSQTLAEHYTPVNDEYKYDDNTKKGFVSIEGKGLEARAWIINKIGEICSSTNIGRKTGTTPEADYFTVTDEQLDDGNFTIYFQSLY